MCLLHVNTCGSMLVDISLSNLMSLLQQQSKNQRKDVRRKELALGEFVLAELVQTAGPNKYETITKLLGTSVFFLLVVISIDKCIPLSKANIAF